MRIAMVGVRGIPARVGGAERVVEELTREMVARGHEVTVYARRHYVESSPPSPVGRVIVTPGLRGKHLEAFTHTATAMIDLIARGNTDIVHVHSPGPALLSWLPLLAGKPVVLTIHAADWQRDKWSLPAKATLKLGLACGMRVAREVTAVSQDLADELSRCFGRRVHYVPNGARPAEIRYGGLEKWGLQSGRYVLTVGRIVPEKRLDVLLQAWAACGENSGYKLAVVGGAEDRVFWQKCRHLAGSTVVFLGAVYGDELSQLYSQATLVVQPSSLEGMSMVLLEAASFGRCILAVDISANCCTMESSIVYYKCGDLEDLTRQLGRLLDSEELRSEYGRAAQALVRSKYAWSTAAELMERIYHLCSR